MHAPELAWHCVRSQPKHEHIAAGNLRALTGIEVFNPRMRCRRATRRGPVWVTEPVFPNYLFAHFALEAHLQRVRYVSGVSSLVHFGGQIPSVPDEVIAELRQTLGGAELKVWEPELVPGESVRIITGAFHGFGALIQSIHHGPQRVRVLLELLGRATSVERPRSSIRRSTRR